jgi:toxin FitB
MYLLDTNILIYYTNGSIPDSYKTQIEYILANNFNISIIVKLEYLGWKGFDSTSLKRAERFVSYADVFNIDNEVAVLSVELMRSKGVNLADAVIAATALINEYTLITRNTDDFKKIKGLKLLNPFA